VGIKFTLYWISTGLTLFFWIFIKSLRKIYGSLLKNLLVLSKTVIRKKHGGAVRNRVKKISEKLGGGGRKWLDLAPEKEPIVLRN